MLAKLYNFLSAGSTDMRTEQDRDSYDTGTPEQLKFICVTRAQADFLKQHCAGAITELELKIKQTKQSVAAYYEHADKTDSYTKDCFTIMNIYKDKLRKLQQKHKLLAGIQKQIKLN